MRILSLITVAAVGVTPVQKVVQMLSSMVTTGQQEKHEEETLFSAFTQWCQDTSASRTHAISEGSRSIDGLTADISKTESDAEVLGTEITELADTLTSLAVSKKEATESRAQEHADFQELHTDYGESIDAVERAIVVLKQQNFDRPQDAALIQSLQQVNTLERIPPEAKHVIIAFLDQPESDFLSKSAPKANAYEFQSSGVIGMLEKLLHQFTDEERSAEKAEANAQHSFEMIVQDITDQTAAATEERTAKTQLRATHLQAAAQARGDKTEAVRVRDDDQIYLDEVRSECRQKSADYENRQKLRAEELVALNKAVEILSSGAVSGHANTHLPSLLQKKSVFLQVSMQVHSPRVARVASFLSQRAAKLGSQLLSQVSQTTGEPFKQVRDLIRELIVRLQEEANEEATHKGWCDTELSSNKQTRDQKTEEVSVLQARWDGLQSKIGQLSQQIASLGEEIVELDSALVSATETRNEEKTNNAQTVKDAVEGQEAVSQAIHVLRDFYSQAGSATSFSQKVSGAANDAPPTFSEGYQGQQSASTGIVGILEVIQSDFARLQGDTESAEQESASAFKTFSQDSELTKATKTAEHEHCTRKKQTRQTELNATRKDMKGSNAELDAALDYFDKLKPSCVDASVSYEDRVARRAEEIQSLKEALQILNGELD